jgi:hypothetical protein
VVDEVTTVDLDPERFTFLADECDPVHASW